MSARSNHDMNASSFSNEEYADFEIAHVAVPWQPGKASWSQHP
jgi:hypothetical protein